MAQRLFSFIGGVEPGTWRVNEMCIALGQPINDVKFIDVINGETTVPHNAAWCLRGITSNERYVIQDEKTQLVAKQPQVGRPEATCAALIPIRKSAAWWNLPQDERRRIFQEGSRHIDIGLRYLPAIARRLHHCRDLGDNEPFDFLTWFEYAANDITVFNKLVSSLRATEEWRYVDREIDIRLIREPV